MNLPNGSAPEEIEKLSIRRSALAKCILRPFATVAICDFRE